MKIFLQTAYAGWIVAVLYLDGRIHFGADLNVFLLPNLIHAIFEILGIPAKIFPTMYLRWGILIPIFGLIAYVFVQNMESPPLSDDGQQGMLQVLLKLGAATFVIGGSAILHALLLPSNSNSPPKIASQQEPESTRN